MTEGDSTKVLDASSASILLLARCVFVTQTAVCLTKTPCLGARKC